LLQEGAGIHKVRIARRLAATTTRPIQSFRRPLSFTSHSFPSFISLLFQNKNALRVPLNTRSVFLQPLRATGDYFITRFAYLLSLASFATLSKPNIATSRTWPTSFPKASTKSRDEAPTARVPRDEISRITSLKRFSLNLLQPWPGNFYDQS